MQGTMQASSHDPAVDIAALTNTRFRPGLAPLPALADLPRPVLLHVGRVDSAEDLAAFLEAAAAGTGVVVGAGPAVHRLVKLHPGVHFMAPLEGEDLARAYCAADVFVATGEGDAAARRSIEALACGVPVAATTTAGISAVIGCNGRGPDGALAMTVGVVDDCLEYAVAAALRLDRQGTAVFGARLLRQAIAAENTVRSDTGNRAAPGRLPVANAA